MPRSWHSRVDRDEATPRARRALAQQAALSDAEHAQPWRRLVLHPSVHHAV